MQWAGDFSKAILLSHTLVQVNGRETHINILNEPNLGIGMTGGYGTIVDLHDRIIHVLPPGVEGPQQEIQKQVAACGRGRKNVTAAAGRGQKIIL